MWECPILKPRLVGPSSCPQTHPPKGDQHQSVGGTEMIQPPEPDGGNSFCKLKAIINQAKSFREKFGLINIPKKENRLY